MATVTVFTCDGETGERLVSPSFSAAVYPTCSPGSAAAWVETEVDEVAEEFTSEDLFTGGVVAVCALLFALGYFIGRQR